MDVFLEGYYMVEMHILVILALGCHICQRASVSAKETNLNHIVTFLSYIRVIKNEIRKLTIIKRPNKTYKEPIHDYLGELICIQMFDPLQLQ